RIQTARDRGPFVEPPPQLQDRYLLALEQLLTQVIVANRLVHPTSLWNERGMLESYFSLAEAMPHAEAPKLMAAAGVLAALQYDSPVVGPYRSALRRLIEAETSLTAPLRMLSPLIFQRLGDEEAREQARAALRAIPDERYQAWRERVSRAG